MSPFLSPHYSIITVPVFCGVYSVERETDYKLATNSSTKSREESSKGKKNRVL